MAQPRGAGIDNIVAYNPGTGAMVFVATFFGAPGSGPLLIAADAAC